MQSASKPKLEIVPIFQSQAFAFIEKLHRHHKKPVGTVFQIAVSDGATIVECDDFNVMANGVATVGRPVSRHLQDGKTLEVTRLCTDGTKNACSMLYSACWRIARELGYTRVITYILHSESGISLKASGWTLVGERGGGSWNVPSRPRIDKHPTEKKLLFEAGSRPFS